MRARVAEIESIKQRVMTQGEDSFQRQVQELKMSETFFDRQVKEQREAVGDAASSKTASSHVQLQFVPDGFQVPAPFQVMPNLGQHPAPQPPRGCGLADLSPVKPEVT